MKPTRRLRKYLGTSLQKKILFLIFLSVIIPMGLTIIGLYYLVFNLFIWQAGLPEEMIQSLSSAIRKVNLIIMVALPIILILIWFLALEISHRIAGPVFRLEKELDEHIAGRKTGPIRIRLKDELKVLVEKINKILNK